MKPYADQDFYPPMEKLPAMDYPMRVRTSTMSVISLVMGIMGITVLPLIGGMVAIATGHAALREIRDSGDRIEGKGMARVGLGLGYLQLVLTLIVVLVVIVVLASVLPAALKTINDPANGQAVAKFASSRGVKMVNELTHEDFELIAEYQIDAKPEEILACYHSGFEVTDPEFALLTKQKLIYLKEGRKTELALKDVASLKDDRAYELAYLTSNVGGISQTKADPEIFHIEVQSKEGTRMRIEIVPDKDGPLYFDTLKSAVEAAGGSSGPK
jgi:Domain of unknown function (DUF4190)